MLFLLAKEWNYDLIDVYSIFMWLKVVEHIFIWNYLDFFRARKNINETNLFSINGSWKRHASICISTARVGEVDASQLALPVTMKFYGFHRQSLLCWPGFVREFSSIFILIRDWWKLWKSSKIEIISQNFILFFSWSRMFLASSQSHCTSSHILNSLDQLF